MTPYLETDWDFNSEKLIEVFDELPLWAAPFGLKLLDGIKYKKGITALDIGFGAGFPLTEVAMRLGKDSHVYGIDPWDAAVDRTEKKMIFYNIQNVEIMRGYAESIPLRDHSVDLIVSNNGLNNVDNLDQSFSECSRIIKKGGQFIQTINLENTMMEFYSVLEDVLSGLKMDDSLELMRAQIYEKRKPLHQYLDNIKRHGFAVDDVTHDEFKYKFVDGTTMLNHHFMRLAFLDGWKGIVPIERQMEVFNLVEIKLNKQSSINGGLVLTIPFVLIDCTKN